MKKRLAFILAAVMTATLIYGCGASSTGSSNDASKETVSTEATQIPAQEETGEATAPAQEETGEATAPAQKETGEATAPAQEETTAASAEAEEASDTSDTPTGFKIMTKTMTGRSGARIDIVNYDEDGDIISNITNDDENKSYYVMLVEKQFEADGKWVGSTIYTANQDTAIDPENLDIFKTEENINATEICTYEDDGLVVERSDSSGTVTQIDTYNEKHQKVLSQYGVDREGPMTVERTYDEQGILIKEEIGYGGDGGPSMIAEYVPIGVTYFQTLNIVDDETVSENKLKYDENGVPVGATFSNARTGESYEVSFELDEYGNLIGANVKDGDTVTSRTEYTIVPVYE